MITTYVRLIQADRHSDCANCGQKVVPGDWIYWHGRTAAQMSGAETFSPNTHQGCFWDEKKHGPAPHLTWDQITAINNAVIAQRFPEDDTSIRRFLGAVTVALARRVHLPDKDHDAGLRMGPDLLEGYRRVLKAMGRQHDPFWRPVEINGATLWKNPEKATPTSEVPRAPVTPEELEERRNQRITESIRRKGLTAPTLTDDQVRMMEQFADDGFHVVGARVIPVRVGSTVGMKLWIRNMPENSPWTLVESRQVFLDQAEAEEDAANWQDRRRA